MSHELRTPLNSLLILAKLLSDNPDGNLPNKQIEFAGTIHTAGSDLLDLINDILDLSKVEAGKMDVHVTEVQLADVRDFAERTFQPLAIDKGLRFAVEIVGATVPPALATDEQRLQQVLKNLLSNAVKFTEQGEVVLRIGLAPSDLHYASSTFTLFLPGAFPAGAATHVESDADEPLAAEAAALDTADLELDLDAALLLPHDVEDDRDAIQPGDRTVLIVEDDVDLARTVL